MRAVLADLPCKEIQYDLSYPNLGILYLIGFSRQALDPAKYQVEYLQGHCDMEEHLRRLEQLKPDVYGLSFTALTWNLASRTIEAVRAKFPNLPIICGGAHPTSACEEVLTYSKADACGIGEGEQTFVDLLKHYAGEGLPLEQIPGVAFRQGDQIVKTPKRPLIRDLDTIPLPAWDTVDFKNYLGMHIRKASPQTYMLVSRGCPYDCNFCSNPVWRENTPKVRMRSGANVAKEAELLYQRGIREIYMSADEFNVTIPWVMEVCAAIDALGHKDLYFQCNVRADRVNDEMAQALAKINIWMVHLGIESGNQKTLDGIGKHVTLEQVIEACRIFRKTGIRVYGFMMLYHAWEENGELRYETPEDVENTLKFARKLFDQDLINYMSWQVATPFPGSKLWQIAQRHNLLIQKDSYRAFRSMTMQLPGVTEKDVHRAIRRGLIMKNWRALRSGNIEWRYIDRIWANIKNILGVSS